MKSAILIILMALSTAALSQTTAKRDSVTDAIVRTPVHTRSGSDTCVHVSSRKYYVPCTGFDTFSINRFSQQWIWSKQCKDCLFNQYRFDMI